MKKPQRNTNPERLLDNGTLDTFLFRIRMEMLDVDKHKQNRQDNLTRKERLALRELTQNPYIIINKADNGSTIVVEDRDEYITNAMSHLNDPNVYQPLTEDISPVLKQNIIMIQTNGFKEQWPHKTNLARFLQTPRNYLHIQTLLLKKDP